MSVPSRDRTGKRRRIRVAGRLLPALALAVLWAILSGSRGWTIGVPVILIAMAAISVDTPAGRWSAAGVARFIPYFLWNSLRGAIDVASRALQPGLPIDPALVRYEMRLDGTAARVLMANTVTLLPGTLSADLQGRVLLVHVLNASGPVTGMLCTLEERVADLVRHADQPDRQ